MVGCANPTILKNNHHQKSVNGTLTFQLFYATLRIKNNAFLFAISITTGLYFSYNISCSTCCILISILITVCAGKFDPTFYETIFRLFIVIPQTSTVLVLFVCAPLSTHKLILMFTVSSLWCKMLMGKVYMYFFFHWCLLQCFEHSKFFTDHC